MDLQKKLSDAPNAVFDWALECEQIGYTPSAEDFMNEFGDQYPEWAHAFPDTRKQLWGECADEQFLSFEDELKDRGLRLTDFY